MKKFKITKIKLFVGICSLLLIYPDFEVLAMNSTAVPVISSSGFVTRKRTLKCLTFLSQFGASRNTDYLGSDSASSSSPKPLLKKTSPLVAKTSSPLIQQTKNIHNRAVFVGALDREAGRAQDPGNAPLALGLALTAQEEKRNVIVKAEADDRNADRELTDKSWELLASDSRPSEDKKKAVANLISNEEALKNAQTLYADPDLNKSLQTHINNLSIHIRELYDQLNLPLSTLVTTQNIWETYFPTQSDLSVIEIQKLNLVESEKPFLLQEESSIALRPLTPEPEFEPTLLLVGEQRLKLDGFMPLLDKLPITVNKDVLISSSSSLVEHEYLVLSTKPGVLNLESKFKEPLNQITGTPFIEGVVTRIEIELKLIEKRIKDFEDNEGEVLQRLKSSPQEPSLSTIPRIEEILKPYLPFLTNNVETIYQLDKNPFLGAQLKQQLNAKKSSLDTRKRGLDDLQDFFKKRAEFSRYISEIGLKQLENLNLTQLDKASNNEHDRLMAAGILASSNPGIDQSPKGVLQVFLEEESRVVLLSYLKRYPDLGQDFDNIIKFIDDYRENCLVP